MPAIVIRLLLGTDNMAHSVTNSSTSDVRKYIFDYFEQHASSPVLEQIMQRFKLDRASAFQRLQELEVAHHIFLVPGTERILMAWPFSSVVTPFKVKVIDNRKEYFANCAWDAVAFHVMLRKEQVIESFCHHCADDIRIRLKDQKMTSSDPEGDPIVYLTLPAAQWWENILLTCSNNMVFFSSKEHLDEWKRLDSKREGQALDVDLTLQLSVPIYRNKFDLDYARPSKEQTMAHFKSLGLTGDFWKL